MAWDPSANYDMPVPRQTFGFTVDLCKEPSGLSHGIVML